MTFDEFMDEVNAAILRKTGGAVGYLDLGDWLYRDEYDAGADPEDVALEVLQDNGFPMDLLV